MMDSFDNGSTSIDAQTRQVARAACLNCRSAKRRCDGQQPVCGPCASRGVEEGGCNFVSSKRGGPRYKGVKGAEAARIKAERERQRTTGGARASKDKLKRDRETITASSRSIDGQQGNGGFTDSESSHASTSPSSEWQRSVPASVLGTPSVHHNNSNFAQQSHVHGAGQSVFAPSSDAASNAMRDPTSSSSFMASPATFPQSSNAAFVDALNYPPEYQQQQQQQQLAAAAAAAAAANITLPFGQPQHNLPMDAYIGSMGSGDLLSFANLELLQRMQEGTNAEQEKSQFADFFSQLEVLPKAGIMQNAVTMNPLDVLMEWEKGEVGGNVQDNELGVRTLLSDFYELVYPACPVLPSPGNLPSLAFYFSGKGPCGLFAALSAVVALHLPPDEAYKTLKASHHPLQQYADSPVDGDSNAMRSPVKSNEDVAAYHAKTSEFILHQYTEHKRTCFLDPTALNPFDGMDEELITIEAGAAHTLLCLYYYGSGKALGHQRAYKHAVEGWELMQKLDLHSKASWESEQMSNSSRPFANQIKLEWAKRVYWCSYTAATVMSCTGGFEPFGNPKDGALDLQLRPSLEDVSAWGVMVRGAQHVSRCYRLLFELDQLRSKLQVQGYPKSTAELQQANAERQTIFGAMLKLDMEISNYTRFDAGWRDPAPEAGDESFKTADKELARSLKAAGRLMTSGAIIILHRAQAFSNARVFMEPQCGIPEASQMNRTKKYGVDSILHHATLKDLPPPRMATAALSPPSVLGRTPTTENHQSPSSFGQAQQPQSTQAQHAAPTHPFLTDRFNGGPFEPAHSLERCRFAASTMVGTLPRILNSSSRVPKLPPYSACSFVLGSYAILMLTLLIQVRGEMEANGQPTMSQANSDDYGGTKVNSRAELKMQLELHRAPVRDIIVALRKFATVWHKAASYESEVSTLLAANKILG